MAKHLQVLAAHKVTLRCPMMFSCMESQDPRSRPTPNETSLSAIPAASARWPATPRAGWAARSGGFPPKSEEVHRKHGREEATRGNARAGKRR